MASPALTLKGIDNFSNNTIKDVFDDNTARIVRQHAIASAALGLVSSIPGAGTTACIACQTAAVYSMYVRMNASLGISLSGHVMKSIASAVIANISANAATYVATIIASTALSFIPVFGNATSAVLMAGMGYATVMIAAIAYGKALKAMVKKGKKVENMSESEIKAAVKEEIEKRDLKKDLKNFSREYKAGKESGAFDDVEKVELVEMP